MPSEYATAWVSLAGLFFCLFLSCCLLALPPAVYCVLLLFDVPMYHPCANTIRRPNRMKTVAVAIHR